MHPVKAGVRQILHKLGFDIIRTKSKADHPDDEAILSQVRDYSMTSQARLLAVIDAVRYLSRRKIPGSIVECGVWRGGSSMAAALTLLQENDNERDLYLFDTFSGMTPPTDADVSRDGLHAKDQLTNPEVLCAASLEDVTANMHSTGYRKDHLHFIVGPVENTITETSAPQEIALLRLDTDWYESTHHELIHLFPRLAVGGVLIIDDYGHWQGAKKAVDDYFASHHLNYLLHRIDYTGRMLVKTS
jgi:O-methyltransferase